MDTQAQKVLICTVIITSFINYNQYDEVNHTLKGHGAEGGALWLNAQKMYPGASWSDRYLKITFPDGSAIRFVRAPDSLMNTTYVAVQP